MSRPQILRISNLLSLSRILLALPLGYCLALNTTITTVIAVIILVLAGVTDGLDGYLARKSGQVTPLGAALDPICDKVFAGLFVVFLILYREFPLWLAAVLIGRDLLLLFGGVVLLSRHRDTIPARLYGKYLFFATVFLLGSYLINYRFGEALSMVFVLILSALSITDYLVVFVRVSRGEPVPGHDDKPKYRTARVVGTAIIILAYLAGLFFEKLG
jgi:cardiolipin synthase (CMP-forming)